MQNCQESVFHAIKMPLNWTNWGEKAEIGHTVIKEGSEAADRYSHHSIRSGHNVSIWTGKRNHSIAALMGQCFHAYTEPSQ